MKREREEEEEVEAVVQVPLVNHAVAIYEPYIRDSSTLAMVPFSGDTVKGLEERCSSARKQWDRFVAVRIGAEDARAMEPVLEADALILLDRHYTSFYPYPESETNLYGARVESRLLVRYAQFQGERVVLRAYQARVKAEVLEPDPGETANDLLVGRVVVVVNPH